MVNGGMSCRQALGIVQGALVGSGWQITSHMRFWNIIDLPGIPSFPSSSWFLQDSRRGGAGC